MSWEHIEYQMANAILCQKLLLWVSGTCNIYFGFKLNSDDSWTYFSGNASHALETGKALTAAASETDAQTNYLTTERDSNGKVLCVLPDVTQARYIRLYIQSGSSVTVYEFTPSTLFSAHEIISEELLRTNQLSDAPKLRVVSASVDRVQVGNLYGTTYGIAGFDANSATIFELSNSRRHIAGWDFTATNLDKNDATISSNGKIKLGSSGNTVILNSQHPTYRAWIGSNTASLAPFRVTKEGKMYAERISITGTINADYIKTGQLDVDTLVADRSLTGSKIYVKQISDLSGNLGNIVAGDITGITITGVTLQTDTSGTRISITNDGITLHTMSVAGKYGTFKYGDGTHYASGAIAFIHHKAHRVPFYMSNEVLSASFGATKFCGGGQLNLSSLNLLKLTDRSSVDLSIALRDQTVLPSATLRFTRADNQVYQSYQLVNAVVESFQVSGAAGGDPRATEALSFVSSQVIVTYTYFDGSGKSGGSESMTYTSAGCP